MSAAALKPVALSFDPKDLSGLSAKLVQTHWEKNYKSYFTSLAKTREQIEKLDMDSPPMLAAGLFEREITFRNSITLHELYFGNLGGSGGPQGAVAAGLEEAYGSTRRFEELFRLSCAGLYGGSGWVLLCHDLRENALRLYSTGHHSKTISRGVPLMVCDMYEHAYAIDFGPDGAKYVDAFWENIDWGVVGDRLARSRASHRE